MQKQGAHVIGLGDEIGSLEVGKQADLILVDLTALNPSLVLETPVRNIVPNLVYAACAASRHQRDSGREVKTMMVAGRILVRDGVVITVDEDDVRAEADTQAEALAERCGRAGAQGNDTSGGDGGGPAKKIWNGTTISYA